MAGVCDSAFMTGFWLMAGALSFVVVAVVTGFALMAFAGYCLKRWGP